MKKPTPAATNAPEDQPTSGMDNTASADTLRTAAPPEALPQTGGSYIRLPDGTLVKSNTPDHPTAPKGKE